jgi:stage IV sporulation protein FB
MAKLKFHPLFVIYVFVCLYFGWMNSVFYYVVTVVLHEYGHLIAMKIFGYHSLGINFNVYGAGLKSQNIYKRKHDIIISMAGPFVNIILIILNVCLWWVFPSIYVFTIDFVKINLVVLIFNLLPIYP